MTVDELTERSTEDVARARADRIRRGIHDYLETVAEIALAYERRDWAVLGYADWQAYVDGEFGAARLKLPIEHRQRAVAELRLANMSQRAIAAVVGVDQATVKRDLDRAGDASASPGEIRGADGKTYPATRPNPPAPPVPAGPPPNERVWVATARKGIEGHGIKSSLLTRCSRATRTGITLTAEKAAERWHVTWCRVCWPQEETTRFAAGDPAPTGPAVETHDPRASREAGAESRDSAPAGTPTATGHLTSRPVDGADTATVDETPALPVVHQADAAAPASAPPAAASPAAGGAGVTPAGLSLAQIGRLRAVFDYARGCLAVHRLDSKGRGVPGSLGRGYIAGESSPRPPADAHRGGREPVVAHVAVDWNPDGELAITYRAEHYVVGENLIGAADVDQALDVLCAYGILPDRFSRQYAAGVQAGMRAGDAIDGEWTETTNA